MCYYPFEIDYTQIWNNYHHIHSVCNNYYLYTIRDYWLKSESSGWQFSALPLSYCRNSYGVIVVKIDKNHKRKDRMHCFFVCFVLLCFYLRQQASEMVDTRREISVIIE